MLARVNRFHGHGSVRRVYRLGRPVRSGLFNLHVLKNERVKTTRVAVVVSRKVHKSAVKRNRIRRRIYERIRNNLPRFKTPAELVVTIYSSDIATMPAGDVDKIVVQALKKARLI